MRLRKISTGVPFCLTEPTKVSELCEELGLTRSTLYRYVGPHGELREHGERVLDIRQPAAATP